MRRAVQTDALQLESLADERVQVRAGDDHIAPQHTGRFFDMRKCPGQAIEHFLSKKCDLAFVVLAIIVKPIASNAVTCDALDSIYFL